MNIYEVTIWKNSISGNETLMLVASSWDDAVKGAAELLLDAKKTSKDYRVVGLKYIDSVYDFTGAAKQK